MNGGADGDDQGRDKRQRHVAGRGRSFIYSGVTFDRRGATMRRATSCRGGGRMHQRARGRGHLSAMRVELTFECSAVLRSPQTVSELIGRNCARDPFVLRHTSWQSLSNVHKGFEVAGDDQTFAARPFALTFTRPTWCPLPEIFKYLRPA